MKALGLFLALAIVPSAALAGKDEAASSVRPKRPSSAEERQNKTYTLDVQPIMPFVGTVSSGLSSGAAVGRFLDPDSIARFKWQAGKSCVFPRCAYLEHAIAFTVQKFLTNSFYFEGGLGIQRIIYHQEDTNAFAGEKRRHFFTYNVENWGAIAGIGNQWQWGKFTLAGRWATAFQSLYSRQSEIHEDAPEKYQKDERERAKLRQLKQESKLYAASIAVGFSF